MPSPVSKTVPYAVVGIILSLYALYVEHRVAHKSPDEEFTALCDIQQLNASCRWVILELFRDYGNARGVVLFHALSRWKSDGFPPEVEKTEHEPFRVFHRLYRLFDFQPHTYLSRCFVPLILIVLFSNYQRVECSATLALFRRAVSWTFQMQE